MTEKEELLRQPSAIFATVAVAAGPQRG